MRMCSASNQSKARGLAVEEAFPFGAFKRRRFIRDAWGNMVELMSRT